MAAFTTQYRKALDVQLSKFILNRSCLALILQDEIGRQFMARREWPVIHPNFSKEIIEQFLEDTTITPDPILI